ncbi:hypothetical protein CC80DRAFT_461235 [Byssothecium circinans]|uniref:Rhodopsin domain-containing protein n=1 Tax=Byssothecium circinans TaxID=147558 RepID=A0A6A5UIW1_9PLEO|nr:hypothetical protein CC80DRAFT_461235 [Byssothecium circinans]
MPTNFVVELWTYLAIDIVVVFGRLAARWKTNGWRRLAPDDWLMFLSIFIYAGETAEAHYVVFYWFGLANNNMTDDERKNLDPASREHYLRVHGAQTQIVGWLTYLVLLWVLKLCWLFFYRRLGEGVNRMALKINVGFVFVIVTFIGTFLTILLKCQPISKNWQIYPNPGNTCQPAVSKVQAYVLISTNIATDLYIMSIPLPMVWSARIPMLTKLALVGMFCGGLLTAVFGILRCIFVLLDRPDGPVLTGEWSCRESFVAVFISNLPVMYSIVHTFFKHVKKTTFSQSRSRSRNLGKSDGNETSTNAEKGYKLSTIIASRKKEKFKHPLSLPGETFYERFGSEEEIVGMDGVLHNEKEKSSSGSDGSHGPTGPTMGEVLVTREWDVQHHAK